MLAAAISIAGIMARTLRVLPPPALRAGFIRRAGCAGDFSLARYARGHSSQTPAATTARTAPTAMPAVAPAESPESSAGGAGVTVDVAVLLIQSV